LAVVALASSLAEGRSTARITDDIEWEHKPVSDTPGISLIRAQHISCDLGIRIHLLMPEVVALTFFSYVMFNGFGRHLSGRDLGMLLILNVVTVTTLMALNRRRHRSLWLATLADFYPALLLLLAYRESGLLVSPDTAHHWDYKFVQWDRVLLHSGFVQTILQAGAPWLEHYLEFAYLLCYPLVPLGAAAVQYTSLQRHNSEPQAIKSRGAMNNFWSTVSLATLICYAVYVFLPLTPPRVLFADVPGPHVDPLLRNWNFWLLDHYSVSACIFPSGHVAAATAVALAVRKNAPRLGGWFVFLAASIAAATVYGRYHYAADALAGALVGTASYVAAGAAQSAAKD
jgi:membrane-associated phospholipid phosphatase